MHPHVDAGDELSAYCSTSLPDFSRRPIRSLKISTAIRLEHHGAALVRGLQAIICSFSPQLHAVHLEIDLCSPVALSGRQATRALADLGAALRKRNLDHVRISSRLPRPKQLGADRDVMEIWSRECSLLVEGGARVLIDDC